MRVKLNDQIFYFADQFAADGSIHKECIECWRILKTDPSSHQWDNALWWISSNGWFEGPTPRAIFKEDPEGLIHAAEQEVLESM